MATVSKLSAVLNGLVQNVDLTTSDLVTNSVWVGGTSSSPSVQVTPTLLNSFLTSVTAGSSATVMLLGSWTLGSSDSTFASGDIGKPVWLGTSGGFSTTAPSSSGTAAYKAGIVQTTTTLLLDSKQLTGIN